MKLVLAIVLSFFTFSTFAQVDNGAIKEWTFMVYLNGDNNLDPDGDNDLNEMKAVGSSDKVNVVVLRDFGSRLTSRIYHVVKGEAKVVKDFGVNVDTGDYMTLVNFFQYVKENFPAKHYLVDIWNHGSGWMKKGETDKGISYDDTSGNHITTLQLGKAFDMIKGMNNGQSIDILGMDACLMAMAEVAYEVHDTVGIILGSQETEPNDGWNYTMFLKAIGALSDMSAENVAIAGVNTYVQSYAGESGVTQSAISTKELEKVVPLMKAYTDYAVTIAKKNKTSFDAARKEARKYAEASYKDGVHYVSLASAKIQDAKLRDLSTALINGMKNSVIKTLDLGMTNSNGISIWMPSYVGSSLRDYQELKWAKATGWDLLIDELY